MNADGHLRRAQELYEDLMVLREHDDEKRVASIVELGWGCALHYLAYGCARKFQKHIDTHAGLSKLLVTMGADEMATAFRELDMVRQGGWYGGKGNGETTARVLELLNTIIQWST